MARIVATIHVMVDVPDSDIVESSEYNDARRDLSESAWTEADELVADLMSHADVADWTYESSWRDQTQAADDDAYDEWLTPR